MPDKNNRIDQIDLESNWDMIIQMIISIGILTQLILPFPTIQNFKELALAVLQIEATMFTVIFSIIALLSGRLTDEYLGVNIIHFTMDIKPHFLKQKTIIISSLALLLINILLYMTKAYNLLLSVFGVFCVLMTYSIFSIYSVISGEIHLEDEIWDYYSSMIKTESTSVSTFNDFINQWKRDFPFQEGLAASRYLEAFYLGFSELVKDDQTRPVLLERCTEISRLMLKKPESAIRGIKLVNECYVACSNYCDTDKDQLNMQRKTFHLLTNVYKEFCKAIQTQNPKDLEEQFSWFAFSQAVLTVSSYLGYTDKSEEKNPDIDLIPKFGYRMGQYYANNYDMDYSTERSASSAKHAISNMFINYPLEEDFKLDSILAESIFQFIRSLFMNKSDELIKKAVFEDVMPNTMIWHYPYAMIILKLHCYLYYLAEKESVKYVRKDLIYRAKNLLSDRMVKTSFNSFIMNLLEHGVLYISQDFAPSNVFDIRQKNIGYNKDFLDTLIEELEPSEVLPINEMKRSIMRSTVMEYVLFLALYLSCCHNLSFIFNNMISSQHAVQLYPEYSEINHRVELETFLRLFPLKEEAINECIIIGYPNMLTHLKAKYKEHFVCAASKNSISMDDDIRLHKDDWEKRIKQDLEERFSDVIRNNSGCTFKASLLERCNVDTYGHLQDFFDHNKDYFFSKCVSSLANILYQRGHAKKKLRKSFTTDDQIIDFIKSRAGYVVIGSESVLETEDYQRVTEVKELLNQMEHHTTNEYGCIMFVKKGTLKLMINKLCIGIHSPTIEEIDGVKHNPEQNNYIYPVNGTSFSFEKDELVDYIKDKWRLIDVIVHFQLETKDGIIADIVTE